MVKLSCFGHLSYGPKNQNLLKFQPDTPSVGDIVPPRSKCCDGKCISFRRGGGRGWR